MNKKHLIERQDVVIATLAGLVLTIVAHIPTLVNIFYDSSRSLGYLTDDISLRFENIIHVLDNFALTSTLVTTAVWAAIGILVYVLLSFFFQATRRVSEDINMGARYVHPRNFSLLGFWIIALWHLVYFILAFGGLITWAFFSLKVLLPFSGVMLLLSFNSGAYISSSTWFMLLAFGLTILMVLGFIVFGRVCRSVLRAFYI